MNENRTIRVNNVTRNISVHTVGRRGPKGDKGDPGDVTDVPVQSVNGQIGAVELAVGDLTDVDTETNEPWQGSVLTYDDNSSSWLPNQTGIPSMGLDQLEDVSIAALQDGDTLYYDDADGVWENRPDTKQYKTSVVVGLNGDFVTDGVNDQVQINQAVQFIKTMSATGYGTVELPDPEYSIGGGIPLEDGIWFKGGGMYQTVLKGTLGLGNNAVMLGTATLLEPLTDCVISDLKIDGTDMDRSTTTTFKKGIDVLYTKNMRVFNVHIYKTPSTGFGPDSNINLLIDNCIFEECGTLGQNPGYNGLGIGTGFYEDESGLISNCYAINNHNNGFLVEYVGGGFNSTGYQFNNCYAIGNKRGYRVSGARDTTFTACHAIDSLNEGYYIHMFGAALAYPQNITIQGCHIWGNGSDGIYIKDQEAQQSGHIIRGNHIYSNTGFGILSGASHTQISGNTVYGNTKTGIYVHAYSATPITGGQVKDNEVYNNATAGTSGAADGIRIYGESGSIDGIKVVGNSSNDFQGTKTQLYGLVLKGVITYAYVTQNDVRLNLTSPLLNTISPVSATNQIFENIGAPDALSTATQAALDAKQATITAGTTAQYYRGDKTFQTLDKTAVGLTNVDNTSDANKPVSTAQAAADDTRLPLAGGTLTDGANIVLGTTTGTKFGTATTQKAGFFNATPVAQQTATTDIGTVLSNLGLRAAGTAWPITTGGTVNFTANFRLTPVSRTGAVTLTSTSATVNLCDATTAPFTITVPTAVSISGAQYIFKKVNTSANDVTIATTSSQTIDGSATYVLTGANRPSVHLISDGANWHVIT